MTSNQIKELATRDIKASFNFEGRESKSDYWWFFLIMMVGSMVLSVFALSFLCCLPMLGAGWRRMQDTGRPGWYCIIPIMSLIWALEDSQPEENEFGPVPGKIEDEVY